MSVRCVAFQVQHALHFSHLCPLSCYFLMLDYGVDVTDTVLGTGESNCSLGNVSFRWGSRGRCCTVACDLKCEANSQNASACTVFTNYMDRWQLLHMGGWKKNRKNMQKCRTNDKLFINQSHRKCKIRTIAVNGQLICDDFAEIELMFWCYF